MFIFIPMSCSMAMIWFLTRYIAERNYKKKHGIDAYAERDLYTAMNYYHQGKYGDFIEYMNKACGKDPESAWRFLHDKLVTDTEIARAAAQKYVENYGTYSNEARKYLS